MQFHWNVFQWVTKRNEPLFYPCSVKISTCSGSFNNFNDPYPKLYIPDVARDINVKKKKKSNVQSPWNKTHRMAWNL